MHSDGRSQAVANRPEAAHSNPSPGRPDRIDQCELFMGLTDGVLESTASRCLVASSACIGCVGSSSSYGKCA